MSLNAGEARPSAKKGGGKSKNTTTTAERKGYFISEAQQQEKQQDGVQPSNGGNDKGTQSGNKREGRVAAGRKRFYESAEGSQVYAFDRKQQPQE